MDIVLVNVHAKTLTPDINFLKLQGLVVIQGDQLTANLDAMS